MVKLFYILDAYRDDRYNKNQLPHYLWCCFSEDEKSQHANSMSFNRIGYNVPATEEASC